MNDPVSAGSWLERLAVRIRRWPRIHRIAAWGWQRYLWLLGAVPCYPRLFYPLRWVRWLLTLPSLADQGARLAQQAENTGTRISHLETQTSHLETQTSHLETQTSHLE
ncbi:MAG: hypothetical protein WCP34_09895, partial [Pseudomonadota bacterium]